MFKRHAHIESPSICMGVTQATPPSRDLYNAIPAPKLWYAI
jgi:hypothetical protein